MESACSALDMCTGCAACVEKRRDGVSSCERALSPTQLVHNIVFADLDLLIFQQRRLRATLYFMMSANQVHTDFH
jgi:hypothetical protein